MLVCMPACEPAGQMDSPTTNVVIWLLLAPCLFLTSQTKVVLTALSTFFTISLLSSTVTVSGSDPDNLDGKERIFSDLAQYNRDDNDRANKKTGRSYTVHVTVVGAGLALAKQRSMASIRPMYQLLSYPSMDTDGGSKTQTRA